MYKVLVNKRPISDEFSFRTLADADRVCKALQKLSMVIPEWWNPITTFEVIQDD